MIDAPPDLLSGHGPAGIVAGIGLRAKAQCAEVLDLIDCCLGQAGHTRREIAALVTLDRKQHHPALVAAAARLQVPIIPLPEASLAPDAPNPSARVYHLAGVVSVAEAAAMRFGPLLLAKQRSAHVTCALARLEIRQEAGQSNAAIAASTLSTSWAGP